jgi:cytochrome d ubiquinol oxidase subunit I
MDTALSQALLARTQMGLSLAFHIVFASAGVAMPLLMVLAEARHQATGDPSLLALARRWAKGTAVLFAVGAVSGTVLSFELGLLFPTFMRHAGPIIGLPFSLEGFAFFLEAIFLGIYLYGWQRVPPRLHLLAGVGVALMGLASAVSVTFVNAWMNAPRGFAVHDGQLTDIDPWGAFQTPFAAHEILHGTLASYAATGLAVAGVHAFALLRRRTEVAPSPFHRHALVLALWVAVPASLLQPLLGHYAGQQVAQHQPAKLAAMEQLRATRTAAPLHVGPLEIPGGLSVMAFNDPGAVVMGLDAFPPADRPPALIRPAFLIMVGLGTGLALYALWAALLRIRRRDPAVDRRFLLATLLAAPAGFVALEAGWVLTEVGRQPWVVYGVIRTNASVTSAGGLGLRLVAFILIYLVLAATVAVVLGRHVRATLDQEPT